MEEQKHKEVKKEQIMEEQPQAKEKSKPAKVEKVKKEFALTKVSNAPISLKHSRYIGAYIKGKSIDNALKDLEEVTQLRRLIPFKGEIPHKAGPGMMSGRYPVNAARAFIPALKTLRGNCIVNGLDLERTRITIVNPSWAFRPLKRGGRKAKRVHLIIEARELTEKK